MAVRTGPQPMPGGMPPMPGIMGAPMGPPPGMPGMGGMPGMPPMQQPMPMPMGGPLGGPAPQVQGGGRPASLGTLPAPSTAEQRAGFGAAVGAVAGMPVQGAMPSDVFAGGIPGGMMDGSIPRPVAQMREGGVAYMQAGGVAKPDMREFMEATGVDAATASQLLYGSVGSNVDIRDWNAIMSSSDPTRAAQEATRQMYSTGAPIATDPRFYDPDTGAYNPRAVDYGGQQVSGAPRLQVTGSGQIVITDSAGLPLTGLSPQNAASFGISQADIDAAIAAGGSSQEGRLSGAGYQPYDAGDLLVENYQSLLPSPVRSVVSGTSGTSSAGGGGMGGGYSPYEIPSTPVPVSQPGGGIMNALPGEVLQASAGPVMGSVYQPTVSSIPTFVGGVSDVFGTRPVTYVGSPQATIRSRIGEIDLPARPESINVFDFLASPVAGYGGLR